MLFGCETKKNNYCMNGSYRSVVRTRELTDMQEASPIILHRFILYVAIHTLWYFSLFSGFHFYNWLWRPTML